MSNVKIKSQILKVFRLLIIVLSFVFCVLSLPNSVYAQAPTPSATILPNTVSPTSPLYTDLIVNNMFHTFSCLMIGGSLIGQPCLSYQMTKNAQGAIQSVPVLSQVNLSGGLLGTTTGLIGTLYANPPVRTADYIGSLGQQLGIVKTAHAQVLGSGASVLGPVLALWQVSRNISYLAMIVVFVVIGMMVLFRNRINPQTVITAQAALPGLVIGLILITFSYFLAGLIADTAFIGTNLVGYYFGAAVGDPSQDLVKELSDKGENVLSIFSKFTGIINQGAVSSALGNVWSSLAVPNPNPRPDPFYFDPQRVLTLAAAFIAAQLLLPLGSLGGGLGQLISGGIASGITLVNPTAMIGFSLGFVGTLALIYAMFKLLLRLVSAFLNIIFLTITGPFHFLAAALPGRQGIATKWVLDMISHALAFPAVIAVFYFVAFITGPLFQQQYNTPFKVYGSGSTTSSNFVTAVSAQSLPSANSAEIVGPNTFPLFGGMDLSFIKLLLAFGALMATPIIPEIIARTVSEVSAAGQLLGQEFGGTLGQGRVYAGQFREAPHGFAREAGSLRDQPGYLYRGDRWQRITRTTQGIDERDAYLSGYRPGQITRFKSALSNIFGRGDADKTGGVGKPPIV